MSDMCCMKCGRVLTLTESVRGGVCNKCLIAAGKLKMRGNILTKAHEIINGQRQDAHGNPEDSFSVIAKLWNIYIFNKNERLLNEEDVAVMMALMKIARITKGSAKSDSYIDCCGYMALAADIAKESEDAD